ncbi:hypothetical protein GCM10028801_08200 [Nocardioides maradonensis]
MNQQSDVPEAYWMGGRLVQVRHVSHDPAAPSISESLLRAGQGPAMNVHHYADFTTYLLEGSMTFSIDGELSELGPGGVAHCPRGVPSTYLVGETGARVLHVVTPGHYWINYVRALGTPATQATLPPDDFVPTPMETVHRLAQANGFEFIGGRLAGASREGTPT